MKYSDMIQKKSSFKIGHFGKVFQDTFQGHHKNNTIQPVPKSQLNLKLIEDRYDRFK